MEVRSDPKEGAEVNESSEDESKESVEKSMAQNARQKKTQRKLWLGR